MTEPSIPSNLPGWISDHIKLYETDPAKAHMFDLTFAGAGVVPTLLLTTKGRKTGRDIPIPLIYGRHGAAFVVIASKAGAPDHPEWYKNLLASPACEVQVSTKHYKARARTAHGEERAKLWTDLQRIYPPYDDYQRATKREIPVVVLDPVS